jgi:hypothetical protein
MLGFKAWECMESTIAGYELVNMIKNGQHINAGSMTVWDQFYSIAAYPSLVIDDFGNIVPMHSVCDRTLYRSYESRYQRA